MKIPILWVNYEPGSPARGYWDQGMIERVLSGELWKPAAGHTFVSEDKWSSDMADGAVIVVPGRQNARYIEQLNKDLARLPWFIIMITGDEEHTFPIEKLSHPHMLVYEMTPREDSVADRYLPNGFPQQALDYLRGYGIEASQRDFDWMFAGQVTHERRRACAEQLREMKNGEQGGSTMLVETKGFTQGLPQAEYYHFVASSKVIPCPSGPETPDTFRLYEALEAGCLPIADNHTPRDDDPDYWHRLFGDGDLPFPIVDEWSELSDLMKQQLDAWPSNASRASAWWMGYKRQLAYQVRDDINRLAGTEAMNEPSSLRDKVTVIVPTSPIPSHPDTRIIEETVASVRRHLPESEIIIMLDGVRAEQLDRRQDYEEYQRRLLWKCNHEWSNVLPLRFEEHSHQAAMMREALKLVRTPLVLFVEHDMPLMDKPIDWGGITNVLLADELDAVRFQLDSAIPEAHDYLMLDKEPVEIGGVPVIRTAQWSQRVHMMKADTYAAWLDKYVPHDKRTMIEVPFHGHIHSQWLNEGMPAWQRHRLAIYAPEQDMRRLEHLDGRAGEHSYEVDGDA